MGARQLVMCIGTIHFKISKDTSTSSWQEGFYLQSLSKGKFTETPTKNKTKLVFDNSFPAGLETPEELLQRHAAALRPQGACVLFDFSLYFGESMTRLD